MLMKLLSNESRPAALSLKKGSVTSPLRDRLRRSSRRVTDRFLPCAALLAFATAAHASREEGLRWFETGRQAFASQDYPTALDAFEKAAAEGLTGPAVQFNIGVAAYRSGRWDRAQAAFLECAREDSMADLAHYNLGLIALARNHPSDADRWFSRVLQESTQPNLRAMAQAQLERLPATAQPERNWLAYGALALGYDDNVALVANSDVVGVSGNEDAFAELQAAVSSPLSGPWRFDAHLFHVDYSDMDPFDQTSLQAGGRYLLTRRNWNYEGGVSLAHVRLDSEGFENSGSMQLKADSRVADSLRAEFRYRFTGTDGLNEFAGLTGHRHEFAARLDQQLSSWNVGYEYRYSNSDYEDEALSVAWHQAMVDARCALSNDWSVWFGAVARHSSYDQTGDENRIEFATEIARRLGSRWRMVLRYGYATNDSDVTEFNYDRNRVSLGVDTTL